MQAASSLGVLNGVRHRMASWRTTAQQGFQQAEGHVTAATSGEAPAYGHPGKRQWPCRHPSLNKLHRSTLAVQASKRSRAGAAGQKRPLQASQGMQRRPAGAAGAPEVGLCLAEDPGATARAGAKATTAALDPLCVLARSAEFTAVALAVQALQVVG